MGDTTVSCYGIPSHQHIHVWSLITGVVDGIPQRDIRALQVRCVWGVYSLQCTVSIIVSIQGDLLIIVNYHMYYKSLLIKDLILVIFSNSLSTWALDCGGGDVSPCVDPMETQLFPITSSVSFTDIPINTGPPKTRCFLKQQDCRYRVVTWPR